MKWYYPSTGEQTATSSYTKYHVGFLARNLIMVHDGNTDNNITISWDGTTEAFFIKSAEPLNIGNLEFEEIWIKDGAGTTKFRIAAYSK